MNIPEGQLKNETAIVMRAFGIDREHRFSVFTLVRLAQRHSRLIEFSLVKKLSSLQINELEGVEGDIRALVDDLNLRVTFEKRVNGYTVRLHDKNNAISNTLGGSNNGYGIGKPKHF